MSLSSWMWTSSTWDMWEVMQIAIFHPDDKRRAKPYFASPSFVDGCDEEIFCSFPILHISFRLAPLKEKQKCLIFSWPSVNGFKFMMWTDESAGNWLRANRAPLHMFSMIKLVYVSLTLERNVNKFVCWCRRSIRSAPICHTKLLYDSRSVTFISIQHAL